MPEVLRLAFEKQPICKFVTGGSRLRNIYENVTVERLRFMRKIYILKLRQGCAIVVETALNHSKGQLYSRY